MSKIEVGVLGATGAVGQRFVQLLNGHPWFELTHLYASERSAGKRYSEATNWMMDTPIPSHIADMTVIAADDTTSTPPRLVFSALDSSVATELEQHYASLGCAVVSNSKNHRMAKTVPLVVPEVNPDHLSLITAQDTYADGGFIVTNPNCTTVGLTMVLAPLQQAYGLREVSVVSMQAASGAGYPGVPSMDLIDNVVPYIDGEEDKIYTEPNKLLGTVGDNQIDDAAIAIDATCNRVAVRDGHLEVVSIRFDKKPSDLDEIITVLQSFRGEPQALKLPSAPEQPIMYTDKPSHPQPALDRMNGNGMSVTVGRVKDSRVFDVTLTLLVHNTIRGAAGAAILNAELLKAKNLL